MEDLIKLVENNPIVAVMVGGIIGVYSIGYFESQRSKEVIAPRFESLEEEARYYKQRLIEIEKIKATPKSQEEILAEMNQLLVEIKSISEKENVDRNTGIPHASYYANHHSRSAADPEERPSMDH